MNKIKRNLDETDESYRRRIWFISEIKPKTSLEYEEAIRLSNIWVNVLFLKCVYPLETMNRIKIILANTSYNK